MGRLGGWVSTMSPDKALAPASIKVVFWTLSSDTLEWSGGIAASKQTLLTSFTLSDRAAACHTAITSDSALPRVGSWQPPSLATP